MTEWAVCVCAMCVSIRYSIYSGRPLNLWQIELPKGNWIFPNGHQNVIVISSNCVKANISILSRTGVLAQWTTHHGAIMDHTFPHIFHRASKSVEWTLSHMIRCVHFKLDFALNTKSNVHFDFAKCPFLQSSAYFNVKIRGRRPKEKRKSFHSNDCSA